MSTEQQTPISLKKRVIGASAWVFGGHIASQAMRLGSNLIMTRLLVPEMFGVMAIANVLMLGFALFSDVGLNQNIIQNKRGNDPAFLNTAWSIQIIRGCVIWFLALLTAIGLVGVGEIGWFSSTSVYADPILPYVIATISFSALISGLNSTKLATANRELSMGKIIQIEVISQFLAIVIMILWVMFDRSIWALVAGALSGSIFKMFLSHIWLPGIKNQLHWDQNSFTEIFHFGKWIFLTSILGFLAVNGDRLLLGGLVDSATLGLYSIAFLMVNAIQQVAQKIIGSVAFPALSEVARNRPQSLKNVYYKFRLPVDVVLLFLAGLLFSSGHYFIELLYDDRYHDAGFMLEILAIGLMQARYHLAGQCYMALGKPILLTPLIILRIVGLFVFMPIAFAVWGVNGAIWAVAISFFFSFPLTLYLKIKNELFSLKKELMVLPFVLFGFFLGELFIYSLSL